MSGPDDAATGAAADPERPTEENSVRAVLAAGAAGTVLEWYDFALYGIAAALVFNQLFFPTFDSTVGQLAAFATFAVGSFVRPLGGIVLGHLGDRFGRKPILVLAVTLMGASTVLIGCLPTYDAIGAWAPILLLLLRIVQAFGAGAELAGAITFVAEHSPVRRRGFYTAVPNASTAGGLLLASGIVTLIDSATTDEAFLSWGWRIPFLASGVIFIVALVIRSRLTESPAYVEELVEEEAPQLPVREVLRERWRDVLHGFFSITGHNANSTVVNTFAASYLTVTLAVPENVATTGLVLAATAGIVGTLAFGRLTDVVGRRKVFAFGAIFVALFAFPFFLLLSTRETGWIFLAMVLAYGIGFGATSGAQGAFLAELFETRYRYTGVALAREFNGVAVDGLTPVIAVALVGALSGAPWLLAAYLVVCQLVTLVGVRFATGAVAPTRRGIRMADLTESNASMRT